jgi:endonuclease/exonuclease/phosphatase family metal-dependent hydrolase
LCASYGILSVMRSIQVVSFNMLGVPIVPTRMAKRFVQIANEFEAKQPDIICLQEVHTVGQLRNLVQLLPSYPYVIFRNLFNGPKGGLVIFSKYPAATSDYMNLSQIGRMRGKSIFSKVVRKGILSCTFEGIPLTILNTQLMANLDADWSPENRFMPVIEMQLNEVIHFVMKQKKASENVLVVGDFNIPKDTEMYSKFMKDTNLHDAFAEFTSSTQNLWFLKGWKVPARIDYIFYNANSISVTNPTHMFTKKYQITKRHKGYISDHIALSVDILFQK